MELTIETTPRESSDLVTDNWSLDAPRGGKAVMNRILKENSTVPLFFAQTLVQSLRDVGYNHTTSALCEHVDNAIQAGAQEIRVYFRQTGRGVSLKTDVAVYDNGPGMSPIVLKAATAFGGSLNFGNREGIGRFGMGMKTAALSMSPVMDLYSWQEPRAIYGMTLDLEAIGRDKSNLVELPEPVLSDSLTAELASLFTSRMTYPTAGDEQLLLATEEGELYERLGNAGTLVYMPDCDRLTYAKAKTLAIHAVTEMSRVYRRQIAGGLRLYVNNQLVKASDPTYSMPNARHVQFLAEEPKCSKIFLPRNVDIPLTDKNPNETAQILIKIFKLPIEEWSLLPRQTLKNQLKVFDGLTVSILRNDREVFAGSMPKITTRHSVTNWYRVQIDFPGKLDEAFGVASNKQGVRLKGYVEEAIKKAIGEDISRLNDEIRQFQSAQAARRTPAKPSTSELKASEADAFQATPLPELSPDEQEQMEANLRGLSVSLKRDGETEDQAFERVKQSRYIIDLKHDRYWPFYDVTHRFGRVILTINTAHPFYTELYEPVSKLSGPVASEDDAALPPTPVEQHGPTVALDLMLLSLARTQGRLSQVNEDAHKLIDSMRREWSESYRVQMS